MSSLNQDQSQGPADEKDDTVLCLGTVISLLRQNNPSGLVHVLRNLIVSQAKALQVNMGSMTQVLANCRAPNSVFSDLRFQMLIVCHSDLNSLPVVGLVALSTLSSSIHSVPP